MQKKIFSILLLISSVIIFIRIFDILPRYSNNSIYICQNIKRSIDWQSLSPEFKTDHVMSWLEKNFSIAHNQIKIIRYGSFPTQVYQWETNNLTFELYEGDRLTNKFEPYIRVKIDKSENYALREVLSCLSPPNYYQAAKTLLPLGADLGIGNQIWSASFLYPDQGIQVLSAGYRIFFMPTENILIDEVRLTYRDDIAKLISRLPSLRTSTWRDDKSVKIWPGRISDIETTEVYNYN